jgi:hypothetical protein
MRLAKFARDAGVPGRMCCLVAFACCLTSSPALAGERGGDGGNPPVDKQALGHIPVREVTVFKDGHAFVLHEGDMPVSDTGIVHLDQLPSPVIGTFWPYAAGEGVTLKSVVAGKRAVKSQQTALTIRDLLKANIGAKVHLKLSQDHFAGTIVSIPSRQDDQHPDSRPATEPAQPEVGNIMVVQTAEGHRAIPLDAVQEVTFLEQPQVKIPREEEQNVLSLQLQWKDGKPAPAARVGMVYLQKGIRWIPSYKLDLDGKGRARVKLQATLINEMIDLDNVTMNLVIGVPHFTFKETLDPISLGQAAAQLSVHFQEGSQTAFAFSNAIQTQVARMGEQRAAAPAGSAGVDAGPGEEFSDGNKREDLYVFTVPGVSLKKGERMVVPVIEFELPYEDVFTVKLPVSPPREMLQQLNNDQQKELARMLHAPKAVHQARLTNRSDYPLTTAPALLMRDGQLLGQSMMTYTPVGGQVDVEMTAAVDITVSKQEAETNRTPNAANWAGKAFDRIDLEGKIQLRNFADKPVKLEVVRFVLGVIDTAGQDGVISRLNVREDAWELGTDFPTWWSWYGWPYGWFQLNGMGRARWQLDLPAGQETTLEYTWHYFGR